MFEHIDGGVNISDGRCGILLRRLAISNEFWQPTEITVQAGPFHGVMSDETLGGYDSFCEGLEKINVTLNGSATLGSYEGFEIVVSGNGFGSVRVDIKLMGDSYAPVHLMFGLDIDQSYLPAIIRSIRSEFLCEC